MSDSIQLLNKILDGAALRHRVLANNVANSETPRFKRQDVEFREMLEKAVESGSTEKVAEVQPDIVTDRESPSRPDGNNVSMQRELGEMTENGLLYQFATRSVARQFDLLRKAIRGR